MDSAVIEVDNLTHKFGGNRVLDKFALRVNLPANEPSSSVCIIGPNGAGKSTLLNLLTGFLRPLPSATVNVLGRSVSGIAPEGVALFGVSRSFQSARDVVPELSVIANLFLVPELRAVPWWSRLVHHRHWAKLVMKVRERVENCLSEFRCDELRPRLDLPAGELSFGWKRIVSVLRAHISEARLIMLDEPFAGLDTLKTRIVQDLICSWRRQSRTLMFVEHIRSSAMRAVIEETASRVVLMDEGRIVLDGAPREVLSDPSFAHVYTGAASTLNGTPKQITLNTRKDDRSSTLAFWALSASYDGMPALRCVNADVSPGQHVLVVGPNGAGKSTMLSSVHRIGLETTGEIRFGESRINKSQPYEVARMGISFVPQRNRVFDDLPVRRNLAVAVLGQSAYEQQNRMRKAIESFPLLGLHLNQAAGTLSGGEQTQLALALGLVREPAVLLADEISVGLDGVRSRNLMTLLRKRVHRGLALMTAEQFYQPALENCDRVLALRNGEVVWQGQPQDFTDDKQARLFSGLDL